MEIKDLTRIARILQKEEAVQPIGGAVKLTGGVLSLRFDAVRSDVRHAQTALFDHHLNVDIDPESSEARINTVDGYQVLEIDVKDPLWRAPESTPPNRMVKPRE